MRYPSEEEKAIILEERKAYEICGPLIDHLEEENFRLWTAIILICLLAFVGLLAAPKAHAAEGFATYYTEASCKSEGTSGIWTASGSRYDEKAFTCALPKRGFGKEYLITNPQTGVSVVVKHTDFGPGKKARSRGVVVELTPAAYEAIGGSKKAGRLEVGVQEIL